MNKEYMERYRIFYMSQIIILGETVTYPVRHISNHVRHFLYIARTAGTADLLYPVGDRPHFFIFLT